MKKPIILAAAAAALTMTAAPAYAQATTTQRNPIADILGNLFGTRVGVTTTIESQWAAGQTPLANQRAQFEARVDSEVRTGALNQTTAARLKSDYYDLVQLEARYGADSRFTTAERTALADRYGTLTQVLAERAYADAGASTSAEVAAGRAEFDARVDAAFAARRITRAEANRLKRDYSTLAGLETGYLSDGVLSTREQNDLDTRLAALDARVGDTGYGLAMTPSQRLDAVARALPAIRLSSAARAQLQVEHQDLSRLAQAYARLNTTADEQAYLDRRLAEIEVRTGVRSAASGF